jgi:hypothetical protein
MPDRTVAFFDSHGSLWLACEPAAEGAIPFGPTGCAREATEEECAVLLGRVTARTAHAQACRLGLARRDGEWDVLARTPCAVTIRWRKDGTVAAFSTPGDPWWSLHTDWAALARTSRCVRVLDYQSFARLADEERHGLYDGDLVTFEGVGLAALARSELRAVARLEEQGARDAARLVAIAEAHGGRLPADVVFETRPRTMPLFGGGGGDTFDVLVWERLHRAQDAGRWHSPHDALGLCVERLGFRLTHDGPGQTTSALLAPLGRDVVDWLNDSRAYWTDALAEMGVEP